MMERVSPLKLFLVCTIFLFVCSKCVGVHGFRSCIWNRRIDSFIW
jgi:hypothetical protein